MKRLKITKKQADLLGLNKSTETTFELSEGVKNVIKISKDQYNRIFASGLINEQQVTGGLNRVDTSFKKAFAGKDIENLKSEEQFKISKPNKSIGMPQKFGKPVMEGDNQLKTETIELIKYLYRKSEDFSPFWVEHGLSYDDICSSLLEKNLIIDNNGKYELSKSLGDPQQAIQAVEAELTALVQGNGAQTELEPEEKEIDEDNGYPAGAASDSNAPWNQQDPTLSTPIKSKNVILTVVAYNREIAILKDKENNLYAFYYDNVDKDTLKQYASREMTYLGNDEDGDADYDYGDEFDIDDEVISNYINDNLGSLTKGEGPDDYEQGKDIVKIDEPLKTELMGLYDKDKQIMSVLGPMEESWGDAYGKFKSEFTKKVPEIPNEKPEAKQSRIVAKLTSLKDKEKLRRDAEATKSVSDVEETTSAASSGSFTGPMASDIVKREMPPVPIVGETTSGSGSMGAYDANALQGINRDGSFKTPKKTKAQKKTQLAGGSFVELGDCTKMNNKPAGSGCSKGAVDAVVKFKKTSGNIVSPSLKEETIMRTIADRTGKTIEEVRLIVASKNSKTE